MALRPACTACTAWLPVTQPRPADHRLLVQQPPEFLRPQPRQRILDVDGTAQAHDIGGRVGALDAAPSRIVLHSVLRRYCCAFIDMGSLLTVCLLRRGAKSRVFRERIFTSKTSQCEFHKTIDALVRQGHFLGAKLRSLRKRNGLTLDELSARCVQIDAAAAPSVSYLSMIENGQRMPSGEMLDMLAGIFGKDARLVLGSEHRCRGRAAAGRAGRPGSDAARARIPVLA